MYRKPDAERTHVATRESPRLRNERIAQLSTEIGRLDGLIGEWAARTPDGCAAPPPALALMLKKEGLEAELRSLAGSIPSVPPGPSLVRIFVDWLRRSFWRRPGLC